MQGVPWWGQAGTSPVPRGECGWRPEQLGPVTLMHSVWLCGHRPLSVKKIRDDFLNPWDFLVLQLASEKILKLRSVDL